MTVSITISVNGVKIGGSADLPYVAGMNVQRAMEESYPKITFNLRYFGAALGYEVVTLNDISNQVGTGSTAYIFWELSINGRISPTGIDSTNLSDGDEVEWGYVSYEPSTHGGTRHDGIRQAFLRPPQ